MNDGGNGTQRWAQVVFADSSAPNASDAGCGVEMTLFVPRQSGTKERPKTLGGFMALPLRAVKMGASNQRYDTSAFLDPKSNGQGVTVVLDTGSQGFWIIDTTRGKDGAGLLSSLPGGYGSGSGAYELELGDPGGPTFTISIPEQWRAYDGAPSLITQPADPAPNTDAQTIILGNPWLQAIAVTFDVHRMRAVVSHLDKNGNRVPEYVGPKSTVSPPLARGITRYRLEEPRPSPFRNGDYLGPELELTSLARSAPPEAQKPKGSDVTVDMRYMYFPHSSALRSTGGGAVVARESSNVNELILPTLDLTVRLADGRTTQVSKIMDTGSGLNLLLDTDFAAETLNTSNGSEYCQKSGTVSQIFGNTASLAGAQNSRCGSCPEPARGAHQSGGFCNDFCCTAEGITCDTVLPCSVPFCTGVVAYSPGITNLGLPSENGSALLKSFRSFAGNATAACIPGPTVGILGFWFWDSAPKSDQPGGSNSSATALPYYVLAELGQVGQALENYTMKFWRSDLGTGKKTLAVGRPALAKIPGPSRPVWDEPSSPSPAPASAPMPTPAFSPAPAPAAASPTPTPTPASSAPAEAPTAPPTAPPTPEPAASPGAPAASPFTPTPTSGASGSIQDLGAGAAYNRNGDRGVQQVVVIEAAMAAKPARLEHGGGSGSGGYEQTLELPSLRAPSAPDSSLRAILIALVSLLGVAVACWLLWLLLRGRHGGLDGPIILDSGDLLSQEI